jgi:hypothetical protein
MMGNYYVCPSPSGEADVSYPESDRRRV